MVAWCQQSNGSIPQSDLLQNFLNANSCPEIQGFLYVKDVGKKSWKKLFICLRRSGLYCSIKGTSKEPRHLQGISDLEDSNIYSLISCKKLYNSPTDFGFGVKPNRVRTDIKDLRFLCAEDEQSRTCWMTAFRLLKVKFHEKYHGKAVRCVAVSELQNSSTEKSANKLHSTCRFLFCCLMYDAYCFVEIVLRDSNIFFQFEKGCFVAW
ncbi:hypothetical protein AB205_0012250 [Aquarana catesbeiana]|uniref:PH domain-containing protein n=1 Tax=Aquarana catesbeiana TaxID=8400 RepID=A0A2G9SID8_AQUCT|nr:hypothetical protein AB205_0012250 [Aquarana catesbeiana]